MRRNVLVFSNPVLREKLERREVLATVRSYGYIRRADIREGGIVIVVYKRGRVRRSLGFVRINRIREITYGLLTDEMAWMCGYESLEDMRKWLKIFFRFRPLKDKTKLLLIEFEWLEGGTLDFYIPRLSRREVSRTS